MSGCPQQEMVQALVEGGLDADQVAEVRRHLEACSDCGSYYVAASRHLSRQATSVAEAGLPDRERADLAGQVLASRYRVLALLGRGGMGAVWRAWDLELKHDVALKVVRRSRHEARMGRRVNHRNVCRVYDVGAEGELHFLTMELIVGETLRARLRRGPIEPRQVLDILYQLAQGMGAIHAEGIIHGDLKPENLMLCRTGRVVVMDLGLARPPPGEPTSVEVHGGTPLYMSPEQRCGLPLDARSDVYALGLIGLELLGISRVGAASDEGPGAPSEGLDAGMRTQPAWSSAVERLVRAMLAQALAGRPAMSEVTAQLAALGAEAPGLVLPGLAPPVATPCPYQGLTAFTEAVAAHFHGRERVVERLAESLRRDPRFLVVLGPSGSGKSSVVQAGLVPALRRGQVPGSDRWKVLCTRPVDDPLTYLEALGLAGARQDLTAAAQRYLLGHPEHRRLLLCLDQAEELLVGTSDLSRDELVRQIERLLCSSVAVSVVIVLRDDFYGRFVQKARALVPWLERGLVNIPPSLTADDLRAIIEAPARAAGLRLEEGLSQRILADATKADPAGAEPTAPSTLLPLLEFSLAELWERREGATLTHKGYESIGGVTGGLTQWADREHHALCAAGLGAQSRRVLTDLVHLGDEDQALPDSRRRRPVAALRRHEAEAGEIEQVLQRLTGARLLAMGRGPGDGAETVEIIHEALLREWEELQRWLRTDRRFLVWHREVEKRAGAWMSAARDPELLLAGRELAEAEGWLKERGPALREAEREFIGRGVELQSRRRRGIMAGLAVGMAAALLLAGAAGRQWRRAESLEHETQGALAMSLARQPGQETRALAAAIRSVTPSLRRGEVPPPALEGLAAALRAARSLLSLSGHKKLAIPTFSPDGTRVATLGGDGTARVWDAETGEPHLTLSSHASFLAAGVSFSHDGTRIATTHFDDARIWDARSGRLLLTLKGHSGRICQVGFSPDDSLVVTGGAEDGTTRTWDGRTGEPRATLQGGWIFKFSADGARLVTGDFVGAVRLWAPHTGRAIFSLPGHSDRINNLAFSPDGTRLLSTSSDRTARIWDVDTGRSLATLKGHSDELLMGSFSPDGARVLTAGSDGTVRVWEVSTGRPVATLQGHLPEILDAAFSTDGEHILTVDSDGVMLWDAKTQAYLARVHRYSGNLTYATISPDRRRIATASGTNVQVLDLRPTQPFITMQGFTGINASARFSADGARLVSAQWDGHTARVWDPSTGRLLHTIGRHAEPVISAALSPSGEQIVTGCRDAVARVWDAQTGQLLVSLQGHQRLPHNGVSWIAADYSSDGKRIVTVGSDGAALVWDVRTGHIILRLQGGGGPYHAARFSADDRFVVAAGADREARVWDARSGVTVHTLKGHTGVVSRAEFSPDARLIATASRDGTARVWDARTGKTLATMVEANEVNAASFSPDSQRLVTANDDGAARIWDARGGRLLAILPGSWRPLTSATFSPDGSKVAISALDTLILYPTTTEELLTVACRMLRYQPELAQVSKDCEPFLTALASH